MTESLGVLFPGKRLVFLPDILADKDAGEMLDLLAPLGKQVLVLRADSPGPCGAVREAGAAGRFVPWAAVPLRCNPDGLPANRSEVNFLILEVQKRRPRSLGNLVFRVGGRGFVRKPP